MKTTLAASLLGLILIPLTSVGQIRFDQAEVTTVGGITYFQYAGTVPACQQIVTSPLLRNGTNFSQTIFTLPPGPDVVCVQCVDCYYTATNATVLGQLAPGNYNFGLYTLPPEDFFPFPRPPVFVTNIAFTISEATTPKTMGIRTNSDIAHFDFQVSGISGVRYVTEASTNLVDWTPVATNVGGPFVFTSTRPIGETNRFYRVQILNK